MKRLAFALAGATLAAGTFAQTQWDLPTGYAPASFQTENVQQFAADVAKEVRSHFGDKVAKVMIPRTVRLSEAPSYGLPITSFDSGSKGARKYRLLAAEVSGLEPVRA